MVAGIGDGFPMTWMILNLADIGKLPHRHRTQAIRKRTEMSAGESTQMYKMGIHL